MGPFFFRVPELRLSRYLSLSFLGFEVGTLVRSLWEVHSHSNRAEWEQHETPGKKPHAAL